jgi:mycothiol synthase
MRHILKIHRSLLDPIPQNPHSFSIRTFNPATDKNQWLELNNAIFVNHPDQGNWALADLENRMAENWFDANGFFLAVEGEKIIGFCWTKIHDEMNYLAKKGLKHSMLYVDADNEKGLALYKSLGFN